MTFPSRFVRIAALFFVIQGAAVAQPVSDDFKASTVLRISELLSQNYVFPEVAMASGKHLQAKLSQGAFNAPMEMPAFARELTRELQTVTHDKHMRVRPNDRERNEPQQEEDDSRGFRESKVLDGNIGYIDVRGFAPVALASSVADEHLRRLADVDALIVDLRRNGGGDPAMVQYLCSYFFVKHVHLNSIYNRIENSTTEYWTVPVTGRKLPDVPLYVLTSGFTFSGGEEFAYDMKTQKRAVLIGETTGGGANPGDRFTLNDHLFIFIPTGRAINPITGTNWEGAGVSPDIESSADLALEKAIELARPAAELFRKKRQSSR